MKRLLLLLWVCVFWFILFYQFRFLRNPVREGVADQAVFLSPAHGTVTKIIKRTEGEIPVEKKYATTFLAQTQDIAPSWYLINIMMTPMNIHYQRAPMVSTVVNQKYVKWKFMNAVSDAASLGAHFENERNEILFETESWFRYKVIQIAWYLARRIHSHVELGQSLGSAETIGLISLWSQVSVIVPEWIDLKVKEWESVIDWVTVLWTIQ